MIAQTLIFCAALAAASANPLLGGLYGPGLYGHGLYGHGLAIKAPVAPLTTKVIAAPVAYAKAPIVYDAPIAYAKAPVAYVKAAPVAYTTTVVKSAPVAYAPVVKAPIAYTSTIVKSAPVLGHTGLLGAPLGYGLGYGGHGLGYGGHGVGYGGHGLAYGPAYGKVLY